MPVEPANLHEDADPPAQGERFDELLRLRNLVVERIVSSATPETTEYRQPQDEWVLLVSGEATLEVEGRPCELRAGDHLFLPAGTPHRVLRTTAGATWVAVHLHPAS